MGTVCHPLSHAPCLRAPVNPMSPGPKQDTHIGGVLPEQAFHPWECPAHLPPRSPLARARGQDLAVREKAVLMKTVAPAVRCGACHAGPWAGVQTSACCRLAGRSLRTSARQGLARLSCRGAQALGTTPGLGHRPRCFSHPGVHHAGRCPQALPLTPGSP